MSDKRSGMGAEVGARKISDGQVVDETGAIDSGPPAWAYLVQVFLFILSAFGVWQILEILSIL